MNTVIMQPYLFPHLGYFQLMHACDEFIIYDDVNFIPRGYIHRNSLLLNGRAHRFSLSVPQASPNRLINELSFAATPDSLLTTLHHAYARAPYYAEVMPLLREILLHETRGIGAFCKHANERICRYLGLRCQFFLSSEIAHDRRLKGQERLIDLASRRGASRYINSIGGRKLYQAAPFAEAGMQLAFLSSHVSDYPQTLAPGEGRKAAVTEFVPHLSVIDALMWCSPAQVISRLEEYALLPAVSCVDGGDSALTPALTPVLTPALTPANGISDMYQGVPHSAVPQVTLPQGHNAGIATCR